ncbi:MAG TPA: hypothetical protein PLV83_04035 [Bacilli bacterium]|nr:hypothetical protein [Bacilli bacterium]
MFTELDKFKLDIEEYVKKIYSLILIEYKEYLPKEKIELISNFDYKQDIVIDDGGKYSKGPGRWENNKLHLSPMAFYENTYKKEINKEVEKLDINEINKKMKNSANNNFTGLELANLIRQNNLSCLDVTKGIVIHEIFHSIITMKIEDEIYSINFNDKEYNCKGVKGEYLEEGLVEYYARKLADKYDMYLFPSIPYQKNVEYAKEVEKVIGKNMNKLLFRGNYRTILNYIHKVGQLDSYQEEENKWLKDRITNRLKKMQDKEEFVEFNEIEELKLI